MRGDDSSIGAGCVIGHFKFPSSVRLATLISLLVILGFEEACRGSVGRAQYVPTSLVICSANSQRSWVRTVGEEGYAQRAERVESPLIFS